MGSGPISFLEICFVLLTICILDKAESAAYHLTNPLKPGQRGCFLSHQKTKCHKYFQTFRTTGETCHCIPNKRKIINKASEKTFESISGKSLFVLFIVQHFFFNFLLMDGPNKQGKVLIRSRLEVQVQECLGGSVN